MNWKKTDWAQALPGKWRSWCWWRPQRRGWRTGRWTASCPSPPDITDKEMYSPPNPWLPSVIDHFFQLNGSTCQKWAKHCLGSAINSYANTGLLLLDPYPHYQCGSGFSWPKINADPDPKYWFNPMSSIQSKPFLVPTPHVSVLLFNGYSKFWNLFNGNSKCRLLSGLPPFLSECRSESNPVWQPNADQEPKTVIRPTVRGMQNYFKIPMPCRT